MVCSLSVARPREVPEEPADAELEPAAPVAEAPTADAPADAAADAADAPAADGADGADGADANEAEAAEAVAPDPGAEDLEVDELGDDQTCEPGLDWVDWAVGYIG